MTYWKLVIFLSFNQVDLQNLMDQTRGKRSHQSKFVKQFCYYTIVVALQTMSVLTIYWYKGLWYSKLFLSLTVVTLLLMRSGETIPMIDTEGHSHDLKSSTVLITLGIGWAACGLSLIFNTIYYALHPSQVTL